MIKITYKETVVIKRQHTYPVIKKTDDDFILLFIAQGTGIVLSFPNKTQIPGSTFKDWTNAERDSEYFHGEITLIQE